MNELLAKLKEESAARIEPYLVSETNVSIGGVDPLGLRQTNFDLMDGVLPALNNVAEHIRPFSILSWAWNRAIKLIVQNKVGPQSTSKIHDFINRIDALYAWSQFLVDSLAPLPGSDALYSLVHSEDYEFGSKEWEALSKVRATSTGLNAPINYGPGLKNLGWVLPSEKLPGLFAANENLGAVLSEIDEKLGPMLDHPIFNTFDKVKISGREVRKIGMSLRIDQPSQRERDFTYEILAGKLSNENRKIAVKKVCEIAKFINSNDVATIRWRLCDQATADKFSEAEADLRFFRDWRVLQCRQTFRLALESILNWVLLVLAAKKSPLTTQELANFILDNLNENGIDTSSVGKMFKDFECSNIVDQLDELRQIREISQDAPVKFLNAIYGSLKLYEQNEMAQNERPDRLPMQIAKEQFEEWLKCSPSQLITNLLEKWIFCQHSHWAAARGISQARSNSNVRILRLRVVYDEGGWMLMPGFNPAGYPNATPDRLQTVLTLLRECGKI